VLAPDGGVRKLPEKIKNLTQTDGAERPVAHHSAPKELYTLTEILSIYIERSMAEWGMLHDGELPPWQYENWRDFLAIQSRNMDIP